MITAKQIILSIPGRFRPEKARGADLCVHFQLDGAEILSYSISISNQNCTLMEGLQGTPDCLVTCKSELYIDLETGKANPQMALLKGKLKVSRLSVMMQFSKCFRRFSPEIQIPMEEIKILSTPKRTLANGPLKGVRILDFSRLLPGPLGSLFLADMGAEVIKIEDPDNPDYVREFEPKLDEHSVFYHALNQGKRSLGINYMSAEGRECILKMIPKTDIFLEAFRPGVMARFGLNYEVIKNINPRIIYASITGFGQSDPRAGHDLNFMAESGLLNLNGTPDKVVIPGFQTADVAGGSYVLLSAVLAALYQREKTGFGCYLDISMTDAVIPLQAMSIAAIQADENNRKRGAGELSGGLPNYNVYKCSDDKWIALGSLEPKFWEPFCKKVNREDWISAPLSSDDVRDKVIEEVKSLFLSRTQSAWIELFKVDDLCLSPVNSLEEVLSRKDFHDRQVLLNRKLDNNREFTTLSFPVQFEKSEKKERWNAPEIGEDTASLLNELGYDDQQIQKMAKQGIVRLG